jgi:copper homeostasis protein
VLDAVAEIQSLVARAVGSSCTVLAGAGLTVDRVAGFVHAARVRAVHFGSAVRVGGKPLAGVDEGIVRRVRGLLDG